MKIGISSPVTLSLLFLVVAPAHGAASRAAAGLAREEDDGGVVEFEFPAAAAGRVHGGGGRGARQRVLAVVLPDDLEFSLLGLEKKVD